MFKNMEHGTVTGDSSGTCLTLVVEVLVHPSCPVLVKKIKVFKSQLLCVHFVSVQIDLSGLVGL